MDAEVKDEAQKHFNETAKKFMDSVMWEALAQDREPGPDMVEEYLELETPTFESSTVVGGKVIGKVPMANGDEASFTVSLSYVEN